MCARFTLTARPELIAELFDAELPGGMGPRYNIAPTQEVLTIRLSADGRREASMLRWGLIPSWADDVKIGYKLINARAETVAEKPSFRSAFKAKRRCLIPTSGFYEWRAEGKKKIPFLIQRPDGKPFALAGLWERWDGPERAIESFTILTTEANTRVAALHDRMPVALFEPAEFEQWLKNDDVKPLLRPAREDALIFRQVRDVVNNSRHEVPECIEPIAVDDAIK